MLVLVNFVAIEIAEFIIISEQIEVENRANSFYTTQFLPKT